MEIVNFITNILLANVNIEIRDFFFSFSIGDVVGYLGAFLLAICGSFEAFRSFRNKRCDVGYGLLLSWLIGEILLVIYNFLAMDIPLFINYTANIVFILIMLYYKVFPKK